MSWRRFCVLLGGLSGEARVVLALRPAGKSGRDEVITDPEQAEKAAAKAWGLPH